jgi:small acid-soluble spore protein F (minor alpha/beta-type SASP)
VVVDGAPLRGRPFCKEEMSVARNRRSLLSDSTKVLLASVQGAGDRVQPGYYGELTSKEAGSFTKYAIAAAERALSGQTADPRV